MARIAGVEILPADDSPLLSQPRATAWVDSSVFLDFWSHISFDKNHSAGAVAIDETLRNMLLANWLALALDEQGRKTATFYHEVWDNQMKERAAPDSSNGIYPAVVAHVVLDHVCPKWDAHFERAGSTVTVDGNSRATDNDERDQLMIDWCIEFGLVFVSRDGKALKRAQRAGLKSFRPGDFAAQVLPFEMASARFMERLDLGIQAFIRRHGPTERVVDNANLIWELYQSIWSTTLSRSS